MRPIKIMVMLPVWLLLTASRDGHAQTNALAAALKTSYAAEATANYPAAIKPLADLGAAGNASYIVQLRLGWLNYCATNLTESITHYGKASRLVPFAVEPLVGMMTAQQADGKTDDALRTGQVALREDPGNYTVLSRMAWLFYSKKDYRQAATIYRKVINLYPSDTEMLLGLGYSLQLAGDTAAAAEQFRTVLLLSPGNARATAGLAAGEKSNAQTDSPRR
jgi:tetratricopeptide (TPR) repeat protein